VYRNLSEGQGSVLLHLDTGAYHGVNEVGAVVWSLLENPKTVDTLLVELRDRLEAAPPTLDEEIRLFLEELESRDLVSFESIGGHP
jgi:hypothetical protein